MNLISSERLTDWTWGTALVMLAGIAGVLLVPSGLLWTVMVLTIGVGGIALATAAVARSRRAPTLGAQVIASSHAEPAVVTAKATSP
jgi:hypothetical protein